MIIVKDDYMNRRANKRIYFEEPISEEEYAERQTKRRKLMYALNMRDKEAHRQYCHEHANGYCPCCGMLIPRNGKCDCGYEVK